jgi:hypothetical protein
VDELMGDINQLSMSESGVEKVSDHGTIGSRTFFEFPENISPRKKNCNNLDKRRNSEGNSHHDLRNAIISASILTVR